MDETAPATNATPPTPDSTVAAPAGKIPTPDEMKEAMKEIFDPEIPINIVDLGLIYKLEEADGNVSIDMTLTSPHCPVADQLKARVNEVVTKLPGVKTVD